MWGGGRLKVYSICCLKLMYTEAVEARGKRGRWMAWCDFKGDGEGGYFVCEGVV